MLHVYLYVTCYVIVNTSHCTSSSSLSLKSSLIELMLLYVNATENKVYLISSYLILCKQEESGNNYQGRMQDLLRGGAT